MAQNERTRTIEQMIGTALSGKRSAAEIAQAIDELYQGEPGQAAADVVADAAAERPKRSRNV